MMYVLYNIERGMMALSAIDHSLVLMANLVSR